jgi:hypothetical protein
VFPQCLLHVDFHITILDSRKTDDIINEFRAAHLKPQNSYHLTPLDQIGHRRFLLPTKRQTPARSGDSGLPYRSPMLK